MLKALKKLGEGLFVLIAAIFGIAVYIIATVLSIAMFVAWAAICLLVLRFIYRFITS